MLAAHRPSISLHFCSAETDKPLQIGTSTPPFMLAMCNVALSRLYHLLAYLCRETSSVPVSTVSQPVRLQAATKGAAILQRC